MSPADKASASAEASDDDGWIELMGDDLVMKVTSSDTCTQQDSQDRQQAEVGDGVVLDFTGHRILSFDCDDANTRESPFIEKRNCLIALGDGDVIPGLEMAARFLLAGNRATVKCRGKYAYGAGGRRADSSMPNTQDLLPNSDVVFDVYIRNIIPTSQLYNSDDLKIQLASSKKQLGNECYQYEWDEHGMGKARALKLYGKARDAMIELIGDIQNRNDGSDSADANNTKQAATGVLVDCLNNICAVYLKAKTYGLAKESAANVLQYDPDNIKALCRAARAAIFDPAGTFEECELAIAAAEEIDAENAHAKRLRVDLERRKRQHKKREKAMYAKMMAGESSSKESKQELADDENKEMSSTLKMDKPPVYLYLFASFLVTLGSLIVFQLMSSMRIDQANDKNSDEL